MSLYQPTNVTPSLLNADASGIVDATDDLTVSWQINGPDAMTAFQIEIRTIDGRMVWTTHDTPLFLSTTGCPAYGKDNHGDIVPFSYTITADELYNYLGNHLYVNGGEFVITIRQIWGGDPGGETQLIGSKGYDQPWIAIASFKTMAKPTFTVSGYDPTVPSTYRITSREHTFSFLTFPEVHAVTQEPTNSISWFRWKMYENKGVVATPIAGREIYDTGVIYGTNNMSMTYDGLRNNSQICVQCTACDQFGRIATSNLYGFVVSYTVTQLDFPVTVSALPTGSAIEVHWDGTSYIPGVATGNYQLDKGLLYLPNDGSDTVYWDTVDDVPMEFDLPWIFVYKGRLDKSNATPLFQISGSEVANNVGMKYDLDARSLTVYYGDISNPTTYFAVPTPTEYQTTITAIVYATSNGKVNLWIREDDQVSGLFPSNSLLPSDTLYPYLALNALSKQSEYSAPALSPLTTSAVTEISVGGKQYCTCAQLFKYSAEALGRLMTLAFDSKTYSGKEFITNDTYFRTNFESNLNAGSLVGLDDLVGWRIYRSTGADADHYETLGVLPMSAMTFYDYTARTDGTLYQYEICPLTDTDEGKKIDSGITTNAPFGIKCWDYSLIECEYSEEMQCYRFIAEYLFGKNLKTGDISNNNAPNVLQNFTKYPTIQLSAQNYKSGSLTSLIGVITKSEDSNIAYRDTRTLRDAILELSNTNNSLFLKTRKGDILAVRVANAISMATEDNTPEQAQTATIQWVEVDNAEGKFILDYSVD